MQQQTNAQAHTLDSLKQALVTHRPELEPIVNTVFTKLGQPETPTDEIVDQLKTMLKRDVTPAEAEDARTFTWRTPANQPVVLTIPLEADAPVDEEVIDEPTQEPTQEAVEAADEPTDAPAEAEAAEAGQAEQEDASEPAATQPTAQDDGGDAAPERERINLLDEIDTLLDKTNVHLLIQRTGTTKDGQNVLSVTVVPQAKDDKTDPSLLIPVNLKGTACELEEGLVKAIRITDEGNRSIEDSLAELEAAKKEAAEAKKAEASKAKKTASKATAKASAAGVKKAKEEEKAPEPAAPSLFDTTGTPADAKAETTSK